LAGSFNSNSNNQSSETPRAPSNCTLNQIRGLLHLLLYGDRYLLGAVFLATSTAVRLLPEKFIIHNYEYFALCIDVTISPRRRIVFVRAARVCRSSSKHNYFWRILKA
jgi:hypothetical protein